VKLLDAISFFLFLIFISFNSFAQSKAEHEINVSIPEVALIALQSEGEDAINFLVTAPDIAGQQVKLSKSEQPEIWINYTSLVRANQKRKITATVQGDIPPGFEIILKTSGGTGNGKGQLGNPLDKVTLSNVPADVITGIGTCYTGQGTQNGYLLNYSLELINGGNLYNKIRQTESSLQIIYTLTDDN